VKWHNGEREEYFGLIAKAMAGKKTLRKEGYLAYDLEDFEAST
jgi:hypothetical protein